MDGLKAFLKEKIPEIDNEALGDFADLWSIRRTLKKNELLKPVGLVESNMYFIEKGAVKVCYNMNDQEVIAEFGYKNTCIFDLVSFFSGKPSHFYIEAIKATTLVGINKTAFYKTVNKSEVLSDFWRKHIESLLLNFVEREIDILSNSPETRFKRLLERRPALFQNIPNKYIAKYLGMSPETFSRLQKS